MYLQVTSVLVAARYLYSEQREGYRAEKWEFYPDDVSAVPVILLIPDSATDKTPAPTVFCFPGAYHNKEFVSGEPLLEGGACRAARFPERNDMGRWYAQNGMVAAVFDPLGIGELSHDLNDPEYGYDGRTHLCYGMLEYGYNYVGYSVFQKLCFWNFLRTLPYVDENRLAVSGHSLGTEIAIYMAMVTDDVKAVVFNDFLANWGTRYCNHTEWNDMKETLYRFTNFHTVPGAFGQYGFEDLCAALAPRPLAINEGGADEYVEDVRRAYALLGAEKNFQLTYYPEMSDPALRTHPEPMPLYGVHFDEYLDLSYVVASQHSFRKAPSLAFLKKHFGT